MKTSALRLLYGSASIAAIAALCACGGGGGGSSPMPVVLATASATPAEPTATPSPYPSGNGDAFVYQGTITQTFTRFGTPAPEATNGATPEPTSTPWIASATTAVSQSVTLKSGATFGSQSGLTELDAHETDTAPHAVVTTIDSKEYLANAADAGRANGIDLSEVAQQAGDSNGVAYSTTLGTGNGTLDQLPENPGAQWSNAATRTYVETDPSSEQISNTYAADGTYTGTTTFPPGGTAQIHEYSDGSGDYTMPLLGGANSEITISPVQNGLVYVTAKVVSVGQAFGAALPAWYPSVPPVFASDTFTDMGSVALPNGCALGSGIATQATQIRERRVRLDVIFGELEQLTQDAYVVPPYGVACVVAHDDLQTFYDYSGQTPYALYFNNTPVQETVTDETLALQKATMTASSTRRAAMSGSAVAAVRPSLANVRLRVAHAHLQAVRNLSAALGKAK